MVSTRSSTAPDRGTCRVPYFEQRKNLLSICSGSQASRRVAERASIAVSDHPLPSPIPLPIPPPPHPPIRFSSQIESTHHMSTILSPDLAPMHCGGRRTWGPAEHFFRTVEGRGRSVDRGRRRGDGGGRGAVRAWGGVDGDIHIAKKRGRLGTLV